MAGSEGTCNNDGTWCFLSGQMQLRGSGKPVDYQGTEYQPYIDEGMFDDHIDALLQRDGIGWTVVTYAIGATDVEWTTWASDFGAPASIFPGGAAQ